jgi:hypothetical protein
MKVRAAHYVHCKSYATPHQTTCIALGRPTGRSFLQRGFGAVPRALWSTCKVKPLVLIGIYTDPCHRSACDRAASPRVVTAGPYAFHSIHTRGPPIAVLSCSGGSGGVSFRNHAVH